MKITSWNTKKNENGTFTGVCFQYETLSEINEITGNYTTPKTILWKGVFNSRAIAKSNAQKAVKYYKSK
jgi:hypothetical protein